MARLRARGGGGRGLHQIIIFQIFLENVLADVLENPLDVLRVCGAREVWKNPLVFGVGVHGEEEGADEILGGGRIVISCRAPLKLKFCVWGGGGRGGVGWNVIEWAGRYACLPVHTLSPPHTPTYSPTLHTLQPLTQHTSTH